MSTGYLRDSTLVVEVIDDGLGGATISAGTGLGGLADRVAALGGQFNVLSPTAGGTTIRAVTFEQDGLRDGEHLRGWMTGRFRERLAARGESWLEVRGDRAERAAAAVEAIDAALAAGWHFEDPA